MIFVIIETAVTVKIPMTFVTDDTARGVAHIYTVGRSATVVKLKVTVDLKYFL